MTADVYRAQAVTDRTAQYANLSENVLLQVGKSDKPNQQQEPEKADGNARCLGAIEWLVRNQPVCEKHHDHRHDAHQDYLSAIQRSALRDMEIKDLLQKALTDNIDDRGLFMKGIDVSYYY